MSRHLSPRTVTNHRFHWLCRLIGRHVVVRYVGQTCSEPEWSGDCTLCGISWHFLPTPAEKAAPTTKRINWFPS